MTSILAWLWAVCVGWWWCRRPSTTPWTGGGAGAAPTPLRVCVAGGSFGGLTLARLLAADPRFAVTVVEPKAYCEYTPGVMRAVVNPGHLQALQVRCARAGADPATGVPRVCAASPLAFAPAIVREAPPPFPLPCCQVSLADAAPKGVSVVPGVVSHVTLGEVGRAGKPSAPPAMHVDLAGPGGGSLAVRFDIGVLATGSGYRRPYKADHTAVQDAAGRQVCVGVSSTRSRC
jgi:hypothetical protein